MLSVNYELDGDVAVITLDRPDRYNAIDESLSAGIVSGLERAGLDARAAVVTGAGKAFCAGADLAFLMRYYDAEDGPSLAEVLDQLFHPAVEALLACEVPVIGALNGAAAGAGLGLALACDIRVMAERAYLTSAFTAIGLAPDSGTTWWLPHIVGVSRALELTLTNRRVGAAEAATLGLCVAVTPDGETLETALGIARDLTDLSSDALVTTRRLIRDAAGSSLDSALAAERLEQDRLGRTPEHREGITAFTQKRKPDFRNP